MSEATAYQRILDALQTSGQRITNRNGKTASAQCPAHNDRAPSLSITAGADRALIHCHAGCHTDDILTALGLDPGDLFDEEPAPLAPTEVASYDYTDADGRLLFQVVRMIPKTFRQRRPDGHGGWLWNLADTPRVLYRLPRIMQAAQDGETIYVVEGEKDVHAIEAAGGTATTNPGGAGKWRPEYSTALTGARVVVIADLDGPGRAHAEQVTHALQAHAADVQILEPAAGKDAADHLAAGHGLGDLLVPVITLDPPDDQPPDADGPRRSWQPRDLTLVLTGKYQPPKPTVGERGDHIGMFYPGRQHTIASESEAGKSWLACYTALVELERGNSVVYIDFEDDEGGVVGRLLALQANPDHIRERFAYIQPEDPVTDVVNRSDIAQAVGDLQPTFVAVDGVTEGMTLHGLDPLSNKDCAVFGRMLPGWVAKSGPAVASLDHVTKSGENRGRYAIGAVHKLNGLNGAAYLLDNRHPIAIGLKGVSGVKIAKDRPGQLRKHAFPAANGLHWFGDLIVDSIDEAFAMIDINAPHGKDPDWRPDEKMGHIWKLIDTNPGISGRQLQTLAGGAATTNRKAIAYLELDGYITTSPHSVLKLYPPTKDPADA